MNRHSESDRGVGTSPARIVRTLLRTGEVQLRVPRGRCARHPRSAVARCQSGETLLSAAAEGSSVPGVIVTDELRSDGVAQRRLLPKVEHRRGLHLNNRAENSHWPAWRRERRMQRFKSPEKARDFLSAHAFVHGHYHPRRHLLTASSCRSARTEAFSIWQRENMRSAVDVIGMTYPLVTSGRPTEVDVTMRFRQVRSILSDLALVADRPNKVSCPRLSCRCFFAPTSTTLLHHGDG